MSANLVFARVITQTGVGRGFNSLQWLNFFIALIRHWGIEPRPKMYKRQFEGPSGGNDGDYSYLEDEGTAHDFPVVINGDNLGAKVHASDKELCTLLVR